MGMTKWRSLNLQLEQLIDREFRKPSGTLSLRVSETAFDIENEKYSYKLLLKLYIYIYTHLKHSTHKTTILGKPKYYFNNYSLILINA